MMRISHNELYSMCLKAFEGLQVPYGLREDAAAQVTGLEMICGAGTVLLAGMLDDNLAEQSPAALEIHGEEETHIRFDCQGVSALMAGPSLADIACARADKSGISHIEASRLAQPSLMAVQVSRCAKRGYQAAAWWRQGGEWHLARMAPGEDLPVMSAAIGDPQGSMEGPLHFCCARQGEEFPDLPEVVADRLLDGAQLTLDRDGRYRDGLMVADDLWARLGACAELVLVPETAESLERGAGVGADDQE